MLFNTRRRWRLVVMFMLAAMAIWIARDFADSSLHDLRDFDPHEVARTETAMWRDYYEHHQLRLFLELTGLLRHQFHLPFWRSCIGGYQAARAAAVFQRGRSRADYLLALPHLVRYYALIRRASTTPFDIERVASLELEWWIIHRERARHQPGDLYRALAQVEAEIYQLPEGRFDEHARRRGEAMLLRDAGAENGSPSKSDWQRIGTLLDASWNSLRDAVAGPKPQAPG